MSDNKNVLIVILNYKGWQETLVCMDVVLQQTYPNYHVMLIENGSGDESWDKLSHFEKNDKVTLVKNPVNLGFAGGVNMGIRYAIEQGYEFTALLNNDAVVTKDWLKILVDTLEKTGASSATGLLLDGDGKKIESTGDSYSRWGLPFPRQREEPAEAALDSGYVFGGTAGASVYRTSLFKNIGLFDEKFFAYFEDTDISFRAQLAGHKSYYEKSAIAYHDHGTTSSKIPGFTVYQTFKNLPTFFWKDVPREMLFSTGWRFLGCYVLMYIRAVLRGQFVIASKGVIKAILLFPYALRERRSIQKKRRVSIDYLKSVIYPHLPPNNRKNVRRIFHR